MFDSEFDAEEIRRLVEIAKIPCRENDWNIKGCIANRLVRGMDNLCIECELETQISCFRNTIGVRFV